MILKPTNLGKKYYFTPLIQKVKGEDLIASLTDLQVETLLMIESLDQEKENFAYADGKWTVKELFQHIIDCERILCYRALSIARHEVSELPGFDENVYVKNSYAHEMKMDDIAADFMGVRNSTITLFKSFQESVLDFEGNANGVGITPRILGWFLAGHNKHHNQIIRERYL